MKKPIILCVDDEKIVLDSLKEQLLRHFGNIYRVEMAESGEETLELFEEFMEDGIEVPVILSDHIMPGMKGDELLIQLHSLSPKTLKILFTGQATADAVGNTVNYANLYRYIPKPWDETDLALTVKEALRSYDQDRKLEEQNLLLQQLNQELKQFNASLEQQVKERTAELEAQKEKLREKNVQLEEANASKDKFLSIIAHDLRSPFSSLRSLIQITAENLAGSGQDSLEPFMGLLRSSTDNLHALMEDLLTWSRIQRGVMEYQPQQIDVGQIVVRNVALLSPNAGQKQITLRNMITEKVIAFADSNMIDAVVRNLLSNALKFTHPNGSIEVSTTYDARDVTVSVSDTGIGISEEHVPKLFRIDAKYKRLGTAHEKGTGLGLILCKEFVEQHSGRIWVESEVGKGSTFKFTLPKKPVT